MSSDEEMGYGSIEPTPKVESTTRRRRRGVAVVAALALFGLVVIGGSAQGMRMAFWDGEGGGDSNAWKTVSNDDDSHDSEDWWRTSNAASGSIKKPEQLENNGLTPEEDLSTLSQEAQEEGQEALSSLSQDEEQTISSFNGLGGPIG